MTNTCVNCGHTFEGSYCNNCGQKHYTDHDKSIKHLLEEGFHFITHFEGTFFATLRTIFRSPGKLTTDYCNGKRKPYFKPVSFYLMIVVLYVVFPLFSGLNMQLRFYKTLPLGRGFIPVQVEHKMASMNVTEEHLEELFHQKSHSVPKILLFLLIPLSAAAIFALYPRRKRMFFDNLILATEINIMYILVFYLLFPLLLFPIALLGWDSVDNETLGLLFTILFGCYTAIMFHRIFNTGWGVAMLKGLAFGVIHSFLLLPTYKILVFETTLLLL